MGWLDSLATVVGVSPSQLLTTILLFASVPLALVFPHLPASPSPLVYLYSALPSVLFLCALGLQRGLLELFAASVVTWTIVKLGEKNKWGKTTPWIVFAVVMGHLGVNHVLREFVYVTEISTIEITGSQMVLCMKLISFAWSCYDGQRPLDELDSTQKASRISTVPDLLPFLGYAFFFPSILAGPSFTYASYISFTSHNLFLKETQSQSKPPASAKGAALVPPGRRRKAVKRLVTGTVYLAIFALYGWKMSYERLLEDPVRSRSWLYRVGFMNLAGFVMRTKYYAVWCIAESSFIMSGLGYNPKTDQYDASRNVRIRSIELAPNFKVLLDSWNINTNVWLRECIYKRVAKKGRKPGFKSTQITFITSALWHGVNPCYLMTFVLGGFNQSLGRSLRRSLRPLFLPPSSSTTISPSIPTPLSKPTQAPPQTPSKWAYDVAGIIATQLALNFAVVPFCLLTARGSLEAWKVVGWYGLWMTFVPIAWLNFAGGARWLRGLEKKRALKWVKSPEGEKEREEREKWEKKEVDKRDKRAEDSQGVASMGMDFEGLAEREEREAKEGKKE